MGNVRPPQQVLPKTAQLFCCLRFGSTGGKSRNTGFSRPFWPGPFGTWRNSGPKTEKRDFPELGGLLGKKSVRPKSFSPKSGQPETAAAKGKDDSDCKKTVISRTPNPPTFLIQCQTNAMHVCRTEGNMHGCMLRTCQGESYS